MIRKATAKRSEANAAVRRRAAGLDQRFKMSASVAGFPSINAATASLSFFCSLAPALSAAALLQLLQAPCSTPYTSIDGLIRLLWAGTILQAFSRDRCGSLGLFAEFEPLQCCGC